MASAENGQQALVTGAATPGSLGQNPVVRQLGVMIGIAASVALGVAVVLWSQTPNYSLLYGNLGQNDAAAVIAALQQNGIDFKVDESTGAVMVPSSDLHQARLKLAGEGLPGGDSMGFELLQQDTGFGTSRLVEAARYQRALEGELARSITTLSAVDSSRVHLAIPKQSVFVRKRKQPSASVVVKLKSGRVLEKGQVASIVHLVASSVPELETDKVTVVDQRGNLLSGEADTREMMLTTSQFEYTRKLEEHYKHQIEGILSPLVGAGNVRAQVTADLDFTFTEQTQETFNPDGSVLRSEQINEQESRLTAAQGGVPGALSNQPPGTGLAPEQTDEQARAGEKGQAPLNSSKQATRNYELDKTVSHTRSSTGDLRKLSVAVVVDDKQVDDNGDIVRKEWTPEETERITQLVREAIGFDETRGDSVRVVNAAFQAIPEPEPLPELAIWEEPWVWDVVRQVGGALLVLAMIFGVLRPTMKRLLATPVGGTLVAQGAVHPAGAAAGGPAEIGGSDEPIKLPGRGRYEDTLEAARGMIQEDPKRVAQVVKKWVSEDGS